MKYFLITSLLSLALLSPALAHERSLLTRVTVYWASGGGGSDANTRAHKSATGARLRAGHCAVDPKKIPYGSKVVFPDATCVAVDTGRDVINRKAARRAGRTGTERNALVIDRFFETKSQALGWAKANPHFMTVRVVPPNEQSPERKSGAPKIAQNNSQPVAKQNVAIPRSKQPVLIPAIDASSNKLVADNRDNARRF